MRIETDRLILREMTVEDLPALSCVLGDRDTMKYYPYALDKQRVRRWIDVNMERYQMFGFGLLAVCLKESGELIGDCGLTMQEIDRLIRPEIGYHIRKDKQRQGYAAEAARAVRDWAFAHTPFGRLYSYMTSANIPSQKTAMAYGCRFLYEYQDAEDGTLCVYALEKSEWLKSQEEACV